MQQDPRATGHGRLITFQVRMTAKTDSGLRMDFDGPECSNNSLTAAQWATLFGMQLDTLAMQFQQFLAEQARQGKAGPSGTVPPDPDDVATLLILDGR